MKRLAPAYNFLLILPLLLAQPAFAKAPALPVTSATYGNLPLTFEANQGQADSSIQFLSHGEGYTLSLRPGEVTLALTPSGKSHTPDQNIKEKSTLVRMQLIGANPSALSAAELPQITRTNYFLGSDPTQWHTDIPNYRQVRYHSVYPGIDLLYYGNHRQLEHDFIVAANANPARIAFSLSGIQAMQIDDVSGDLLLNTSSGQLRLHKPVSYQETNGHRTPVSTSYRLLPDRRISFNLGSYDHQHPLIIDPVLSYSTYLGGTGSANGGDQGNAIAVDAAGNAYITGTTYSTNFPTTTGAFQAQNNGAGATSVVFVSKLSSDGSSLIYSTYLGGTGGDQGYGIALDSSGDTYITGVTSSSDFPVTCGAFQTVTPTKTAATADFVTRLNATGSALIYSTYLGGSGNQSTPALGDVAQSIAVDNIGNAYIAGYTWSSDFPTTAKAFQTGFSGSTSLSNGFVTKLNPMGTAEVYSTYLGGSGSAAGGDVANAIAIDAAGNAYIAGTTGSENFPVTSGAFQTSSNGGSTATNGFVTELNATGKAEVYSTYLGGSGGDAAIALAVDSTGYVFVAGNTASADFPVTSGVIEGSSYGENAAYLTTFVTRIAPGGASLAYSTHLQGRVATINGMAIDSSGNAYLVGNAVTAIPNAFGGFQSTPDALSTPASQNYSAFLVKLNATATAMNYATLLGGSNNDSAIAVAVDSNGNAYLTGNAASTNFPITSGAFEPKPGQPANEQLPVTFTVTSQELDCSSSQTGYAVSVNFNISSDPSQPAPTGQVDFIGDFVVGDYGVPLVPGSNGVSTVSVNGNSASQSAPIGGVSWQLNYYGDSIHAPGQFSGTTTGTCTDAAGTRKPVRGNAAAQHSAISSAALHAHPLIAGGQPQASSTAFVSKFALAAENNATTYPPVPTDMNTFMIVDSQSWYSYSICGGPPVDGIAVSITVYTNQVGPALNGNAELNSDAVNLPFDQQVYGYLPLNSSGVVPLGVSAEGIWDGGWSATYSSDPNWNYSTISGTAPFTPCSSLPPDARSAKTLSAVRPRIQIAGAPHIAAAKFTPPVSTAAAIRPAAQPQATAACIAPVALKPLTIRIGNRGRLYGAANPVFAYSVTGLTAGDTITVTPVADATPASPVGAYSVTATLAGNDLTSYAIQLDPGTLTVNKAPIYVSARNVPVRYGQTPPALTAYFLAGFVNGDTASVVSGAPVLTTTVTSATPVGFYKINAQTGTLSAQNYYFDNFSNGEGSVQVTKAPLHIHPASFTIHAGDPLPAFTYTLTGFVNGDTQATATTGAAVITTPATTPTKFGHYYIIGAQGSLQAQNYYFLSFVDDYGFLTVLR